MSLKTKFPKEFELLQGEIKRQDNGIELIASENYVSDEVLEALGTQFTNKYSEGYPGKRYYGGQEFTDQIEQGAIDLAKEIFHGGHANVQPLSGAIMNLAAYSALVKPGETILAMDLSHGGHLTHGHPLTFTAKVYNFENYKTEQDKDGEIDFVKLLEQAKKVKPKLIVAGFSSYSKTIDWAKFRKIADEVGALLMADVSHIGGFIACGALKNPLDYGFDLLTTTTHKTLRGPRGGLIVTKTEELGKKIDKAVFPGIQGGPIMNIIFAKLICFKEAKTKEFKEYCLGALAGAKIISETFQDNCCVVVNGTSENHIVLLNTIKSFDLPGKKAQEILEEFGITVNMNVLPDDDRSPLDPSGIRIGTPAMTTRGFKTKDFKKLADLIISILGNYSKSDTFDKEKLIKEVADLIKNTRK